jgi:preprotein translocase subunit SecE
MSGVQVLQGAFKTRTLNARAAKAKASTRLIPVGLRSKDNADYFVRKHKQMAKKGTTTPDTTSKEPASPSNTGNFIAATKDELAKVVWPSRQQLISESIAVILMVILVATVIYLVDNLFTWGSGKVFG